MEKIKAIFVNPGKAAYGSGQSMLGLLEHRGFDAEVICPGGGPLEESLRKIGVKHHHLEFSKFAFYHRPDWQFSFYRKLRQILKTAAPDVLVINLDGNTPLVTLAAVRLGIPIVRFSRFEFQAPTRWLDEWCWLKAAALICPSELVKQQVLAWAPADFREQVKCWYDPHVERPVAATEIQALQNELGLDQAKTVVFVGRLHPLKRIETAIRALSEIQKNNAGVRLLIVGGHDGSASGAAYEQSLRELASNLGLSRAVSFLGYRDRNAVPVVMAAADVCVLPSESESFGMVLTEAWAVGKPTVASDVGGCREITQASGGGFLCPVGDHQSMAAQILKLIQDASLADTMGSSGKIWVATHCGSHTYAERFHQLVLRVAGKSPTRRHFAMPVSTVAGVVENNFDKTQKMEEKVGIATFYHESHPGAVLQAYALSKTLNHLGHGAEMIAYHRPVRGGNSSSIKQQLIRITTQADRRDAAYKQFRTQFLRETPRTYFSYKALAEHPPTTAAYICGSDQIWNPALLAGHDYDPAYFLQFGTDAVPRIAYAASFGGHQPDKAQAEQLRKYLARFTHISVREPEGQAFLKNLLGRNVALTLDPTLLPDNYNELLPTASQTETDGYVLLYGLQHSPEIQMTAKSVADYMNKPLWSCGGPLLFWKRAGIRKPETDPLQWLKQINGASVVVTNSYHGMIFSLLMRKRVVVVPLQGSNSASNERLFHLCDVLGIREQVIPKELRQSLAKDMDWDTFDARLAEQRQASIAFLRTALSGQ